MAHKKQVGTVIFVSRKGNYVFIKPQNSQERLFCHRSEFPDDKYIKEGVIISFRVRRDDKQQIKNVTVAKERKVANG